MQKSETAGQRLPEANNAPASSWFEKTKSSLEQSAGTVEPLKNEKEESVIAGKIHTAVADTIRDIVTANKMAVDAFEGDTALMQIAKGGMTTLVGVGLERALEDSFRDAISVGGKGRFLDKPFVQLSDKTRREIASLRINNTKWYDFVYHAGKDLATGVIYNGLAFFSRPMLKSAGSEHMLTAISLDAMEALGTVGLDTHYAHEEAAGAVDAMRTKRDDLRREIRERGKPAQATSQYHELHNLREQRDRLGDKIRRDAKKIPEDQSLAWQMTARKYLNYSNPATLLGLDMMMKGAAALVKNFREVRKTRKEKGGLAGKSVYMPKGEGKPRWDRKPWSGNKDYRTDQQRNQVYYGKGSAPQADAKAQEEEDRAKLM